MIINALRRVIRWAVDSPRASLDAILARTPLDDRWAARSGPSSAGLPLTVIVKALPVLGAPQHRAHVVLKFTLREHRHAHSVAICYGGLRGPRSVARQTDRVYADERRLSFDYVLHLFPAPCGMGYRQHKPKRCNRTADRPLSAAICRRGAGRALVSGLLRSGGCRRGSFPAGRGRGVRRRSRCRSRQVPGWSRTCAAGCDCADIGTTALKFTRWRKRPASTGDHCR